MVIVAGLGGRIQSLWDTVYSSAMVNKTVNKAHFHTAVGREVDLRVREVILGPSRDQSGVVLECHSGVNSESILRSF